MKKTWFKNAIIYSLDVETFLDSNADGVGDLTGLTHSLNYLAGLGVTCIWILPLFSTPNKDNGYDIKDYYSVSTKLGNLGGFVEFLDAAEELGIRVIIDLVVNHTSDQHPWFREAVKSKDSKYRDYYIWMNEKPKNDGDHAIFGKKQGGSNWAFNEDAGAYYYHTFYPFQPDLNMTNPEVRTEIRRVMHFWLKLGVSGFRMDAVPHMLREKGNARFNGDPHDLLRELREFIESQRKDAIILAEVDTEPDQYQDFFGKGDQVHMLLNFYLNNYIFLALAREEASPIIKALKNLPQNSLKQQLATFIRNHDELDLERLSEKEREEVYAAFAPDEGMKIYGRGIRRRLAPMLKNNRKKIELAYSLLFSLPGTPVVRYGQEIGMGEDLGLEERNSVRTPMQWTSQKNAGFSKAEVQKIVRPVIGNGAFSYRNVNVKDQHRDSESLLNWFDRIISFRKECVEFGFGEYEVLETSNKAVLAHACRWKEGLAIAIHNFSDKEVKISLNLEKKETEMLIDVFGDQQYAGFDPASQEITLGPYGYRWLHRDRLYL